ncbi:hypothetical protein [Spiroplasma alleghenense]|uniref:Uncharacterized protein n=1 Tax=Spiroplasma alleghenense TaxID=216931 RepID=A0A345Z4M5_9MOLU|nr:hypothetical protein [Spiroplasma alleghenense]AXK51554.1 hypothetical protein SALLE_v1c08840 [Spiroplasma alleghenense]
MKIRKRKKTYIWLGVIGSLVLVSSSSAVLANSLSHNNNFRIRLKNNYNFTSNQQVISAFQKADIEEEIIAQYLNELENVSGDSFNKSVSKNGDFVDVNLQIQNEISSRLVTRKYSEGQVREQIGFVKNILFQNILAYENLVSSDDYDQIMKIEFFKYNFDEWSNLNNVEKYKYIYDYRETLILVLQNLVKTKEIKQELMKIEFEENLAEISKNKERIEIIEEETKDADNSIREVNMEIKNIENLDNTLINEIDLSNNNFQDITSKYAWTMTKGCITIGLTTWSIFWPPASFTALASGKFFENAANDFKDAISYSEFFWEKSLDNLSKELKKFEKSLNLTNRFIKNSELSDLYKNVLDNTIKNVKKALRLFNIFITAVTMGYFTDHYCELKKEFKSTTKTIESQSLSTSKDEIGELTSRIKAFDNIIFNLLSEKNNLNYQNKIMKTKNNEIELFNQEIEENFIDIGEKFSFGNLIQESDFMNEKKSSNINNFTKSELTKIYVNSRRDLEESIKNLKIKLEIFNLDYTYNDRLYWKTIFEDIFNQNINILSNLFY